MTAVRCPALTCDRAGCHRAIWTLDTRTIPELRRTASHRGWALFDRKDWCPQHAVELGVRQPS